jgi:hypothetical protein
MTRFNLHFPRTLALSLMVLIASAVLPAAGVDGTWNFVFITEVGDRPFAITLKSDGESVSGPFMNQEMKGTYRDGKLMLKLADFYSPDAGMKADLALEGVVTDGKIEGTWQFSEYSGPMKGSLSTATAAAAADVNGLWNFVLITEIGDKPAQVNVKADGDTISGTAGEQAVTGSFKDGVLSLVLKEFYSPDAGFKADLKLQGKVTGKEIAGTWSFGEYSGPLKGAKGE